METNPKRKRASHEKDDSKRPKREVCPHGEKCWRRNPHHFREFDHPHLTKLLDQNDSAIPSTLPQEESIYLEQLAVLRPLSQTFKTGATRQDEPASSTSSSQESPPTGMLAKLITTNPYNIFFSTIPESPNTLCQNNSITFTDLLCPTLGKLQSSLQINFMIDIGWLMMQYKKRNLHQKPLTLLYGDNTSFPGMKECIDNGLPNVTHHFVKVKDPFGCHHSKIGIYLYEDSSFRIVVSTANLHFEDWNNYNQSLWMSPLCRRTEDEENGESVTGFKRSLLEYLRHYRLPCLEPWIDAVKYGDFGDVKVFLVTSVPGKYFPKDAASHLYRTADLLSRHCSCPPDWSVIAQASSLGSFGKSANEWLCSTFLRNLAGTSAGLRIVFPTVANVMSGYFGRKSGGCLPYSKVLNEKQRWLQEYLCRWSADGLHRSRAMPHTKSYCRVSPRLDKLAWFLLTSANISKSAWGGRVQKNSSVYVRSYEAGVMFLPKFFGKEHFEIALNKNRTSFPMMYDLPVTSYEADDYSWCV